MIAAIVARPGSGLDRCNWTASPGRAARAGKRSGARAPTKWRRRESNPRKVPLSVNVAGYAERGSRRTARLIPAQAAKLGQIEVAAAEHADDLRPGRRVDLPSAERRDSRRRRPLGDELCVGHRPKDVLEDPLIGHRDDLVHEAADELEGRLPHALDAQAVDDRVHAVERHELAALDTRLHRRPV